MYSVKLKRDNKLFIDTIVYVVISLRCMLCYNMVQGIKIYLKQKKKKDNLRESVLSTLSAPGTDFRLESEVSSKHLYLQPQENAIL